MLLELHKMLFMDCRARGCKVPNSVAPQGCINKGCHCFIHFKCYEEKIRKKHNLKPLIHPDNPDVEEVAACTKACPYKHSKQMKKVSMGQGQNGGTTSSIRWENDGSQGPNNPNTSIKVLLDWMTMLGNYANYLGCNANKKKAHYQQESVNKINWSGVLSKRTPKQVSLEK
jgi:hypothetical protein